MTFRIARPILAAAVLLLAAPAAAHAASPAKIHEDAADGRIDGTYSLADLRAADRAVSSEQREYYGWDDVYRDHLKERAGGGGGGGNRAGASDTPGQAGSGPVAARDVRSGEKRSGSTGRRATGTGSTGSTGSSGAGDEGGDAGEEPTTADDEVTSAAGADRDARSASAGDAASFPVLLWLVVALPAVVFVAGAWRMRRARRGRDRGAA